MKRHWEPEELIEQFILTPAELALLPEDLTNANPCNRLGLAVLLKFFQVEARFPQHPVEVPVTARKQEALGSRTRQF